MKMVLVDTSPTIWKGVVEIEGELFKVTLWPGSATEEWSALLTPTLFVELSPEGKIVGAIEEARVVRVEEDNLQTFMKLVNDDPSILDKFKEIINGITTLSQEGKSNLPEDPSG